jgi:hypothetical protein
MAEALTEISNSENCPKCTSKLPPRFSTGRVVCSNCGWTNQPKNTSAKNSSQEQDLTLVPKIDFQKLVTDFIKTRNGERVLIVAGTFIITSFFWSGILSGNSKKTDLSSTSEAESVSHAVIPKNEILQPKPLPDRGVLGDAVKFEFDDASAVARGTPRPTYPPTLAVLAGNPPQGTDVCNLPYQAIIKLMYEKCFPTGISYVSMANMIGWAGEETSRSGDTVTFRWGNGKEGSITAIFNNNKLTSISQNGLK